ncbi:MAG: MBL fold metallo-hydrolase, partial [Rhodothermales bacterium]
LKGMKWFLGHAFHSKENRLPPVLSVEPSSLRTRTEGVRFTWIGHSTMLIQKEGRTLLIDPMFGERASPFSFAGPRREPVLPIVLEDLPPIDVVIVSHDHYDHLDRDTVRKLVELHDPLFLAPLGVAEYLTSWGSSRVLELDWWQYVELDDHRYHCVPAKHFSGRGMMNRNRTLWAGWHIEMGSVRVHYAGDTGYAPHFKQVRERLGRPDVALMPIGAYLPQWLMHPVHVRPDEAIEAFRDLEAEHVIPVHWGTFDLAEEPLHVPVDTLRRLVSDEGIADRVHILEIGGMWTY